MVLRKRLFSGDSSRLSLLAMLVGAMSAACPPPPPVDAGKDGEPDSTRSDVALETSMSDVSSDVPSVDVVSRDDVPEDRAPIDAVSSDVSSSDARADVSASDVGDSGPSADADARADVSTIDVVDSGLAVDAARDAADAASSGMDATMSADAASPDVIARDSSYTDVYRSADARTATCSSSVISVPAGGSIEFEMTTAIVPDPGVPLPCIDPAVATYSPAESYSYRVQIASPSHVTVMPWRGSVYGGVVRAIAQDCASPNPACIVAARHPFPLTEFLMPGTYEIQKWGPNRTTVYVEPPLPAPTNTRCETAIDINAGVWTSMGPRVVDAQPRFARFRANTALTGVNTLIALQSDGNSGYGRVIVRDGCGPTALEVARIDSVPFLFAPLSVPVENNRDYFIEFSNIMLGTRFSASLERGF